MTIDPLTTETTGTSPTTIRHTIATAIRDDVLDGLLTPGDRLPEPMLAARFGVSRVPAREALAQLQSEGFVRLERYKGATVSDESRADTLEVLQVRRGPEGLGTRLAAACRGRAQADGGNCDKSISFRAARVRVVLVPIDTSLDTFRWVGSKDDTRGVEFNTVTASRQPPPALTSHVGQPA